MELSINTSFPKTVRYIPILCYGWGCFCNWIALVEPFITRKWQWLAGVGWLSILCGIDIAEHNGGLSDRWALYRRRLCAHEPESNIR